MIRALKQPRTTELWPKDALTRSRQGGRKKPAMHNWLVGLKEIIISLFEVISLFHSWVTCLPGWNRKTVAFICLYCDYFAIKFLVSLKVYRY